EVVEALKKSGHWPEIKASARRVSTLPGGSPVRVHPAEGRAGVERPAVRRRGGNGAHHHPLHSLFLAVGRPKSSAPYPFFGRTFVSPTVSQHRKRAAGNSRPRHAKARIANGVELCASDTWPPWP